MSETPFNGCQRYLRFGAVVVMPVTFLGKADLATGIDLVASSLL